MDVTASVTLGSVISRLRFRVLFVCLAFFWFGLVFFVGSGELVGWLIFWYFFVWFIWWVFVVAIFIFIILFFFLAQ